MDFVERVRLLRGAKESQILILLVILVYGVNWIGVLKWRVVWLDQNGEGGKGEERMCIMWRLIRMGRKGLLG